MSGDVTLACEAVLFDCDGVLVDSLASGEQAWTRWAREYGLDPARVLDGVHGRRSFETVALYLPAELRAEATERIDSREIADAGATVALAGARDLLATLPSNWAVVTSASAPLLAARLAAAGISAPEVVVTAGDVASGKPAPDGYLLAAQRLGTPIERCVVVEDSPTGVRAGLAAGAAHVVGVGQQAAKAGARPAVHDLQGVGWAGGELRIAGAALLP